VAGQILRLQQVMRQRVWEAAHVELKTITLDTDTTVHTLFGHQMGGRKSYNPKTKERRVTSVCPAKAGVFSGSQREWHMSP
jgi:sigma54-dependent transcription regulator